MAVSWRDALKQAAAPPAPPARPAAIDPAAVSPALKALLDERKRMEAGMAGLTGQATSDPRFAVAPLAQRRAELARWSASRDAARPTPQPRTPEWQRAVSKPGAPDPLPADRSAGGRMPAEPVAADRPSKPVDRPTADKSTADRLGADRSVAGRMLAALAEPALRDTPGGTPGGTAASADAFTTLRDAVRAAARQDPSGFTARAFDRIPDAVAKPRKAEEALDRAKKAIDSDWRGRARALVPDLVKELPFSPKVKEALKVAVGSVDDLTDRAERLRDTLRDARELKAADEAGDDRRRDRALERLKAKRQEDA